MPILSSKLIVESGRRIKVKHQALINHNGGEAAIV